MIKQDLLERTIQLQTYVRELIYGNFGLSENELDALKVQSQLLDAIAVSLSSQIDSQLLLPGLQMTVNGVEISVTSLINKIDLFGSHLLHGSSTEGEVTDTPIEVTTVTPTNKDSEGTTHESVHSTDSSVDLNEFKQLISKASELQEKAKTTIKKLVDSHKISEALGLESSVKRMEELVDELKIYLTEIVSIKSELITVQNKIQTQI